MNDFLIIDISSCGIRIGIKDPEIGVIRTLRFIGNDGFPTNFWWNPSASVKNVFFGKKAIELGKDHDTKDYFRHDWYENIVDQKDTEDDWICLGLVLRGALESLHAPLGIPIAIIANTSYSCEKVQFLLISLGYNVIASINNSFVRFLNGKMSPGNYLSFHCGTSFLIQSWTVTEDNEYCNFRFKNINDFSSALKKLLLGNTSFAFDSPFDQFKKSIMLREKLKYLVSNPHETIQIDTLSIIAKARDYSKVQFELIGGFDEDFQKTLTEDSFLSNGIEEINLENQIAISNSIPLWIKEMGVSDNSFEEVFLSGAWFNHSFAVEAVNGLIKNRIIDCKRSVPSGVDYDAPVWGKLSDERILLKFPPFCIDSAPEEWINWAEKIKGYVIKGDNEFTPENNLFPILDQKNSYPVHSPKLNIPVSETVSSQGLSSNTNSPTDPIILVAGGNTKVPEGKLCVSVISGLDVDVSSFRLYSEGKVRKDEDMVFFGQTKNDDGTIEFSGGGKNSTFIVNLNLLQADVKSITFSATCDEGCTISNVQKLSIHVKHEGHDIVHGIVDIEERSEAALILGELYRRNNEWKFRFLSHGFSGGLEPLAKHFGVDVA